MFAWKILLIKKLEIEKTKPIYFISVLKVDLMMAGLVLSISNFFANKNSQANKAKVGHEKNTYLK